MKVKLFIHKNHNLSVPDLAYGSDGRFHEIGKFIDVKDDNGNLVYENKSATASFVEGEEIPAEYLNGDYVQKEEEINDEEITNRLSTFKAEGYRGDFASMAKLMAMGMDTMAVTRALPSILPTTNLQYNDIRDVLNFNGGAVGNNMASLFKEAAKINPWSKYKPLKLNILFCQDFSSSKPNYYSGWWKGSDGKCGFNLNILDDTGYDQETILRFYRDNTNWTHNLPTGGSNEPYRLGDFAGYYTHYVPFVSLNNEKPTDEPEIIELPYSFDGIYSYRVIFDDPQTYSDNAGYDSLQLNNLIQLSDLQLPQSGESSLKLPEGRLAVLVSYQKDNPIENGWDISFDIDNWTFKCDKKIKDDGYYVDIPRIQFNKPFWIVSAIVFGYNEQTMIGIPWDNTHYPAKYIQINRQIPRVDFTIKQWATYPVIKTWKDIKWIETDDVIALPVASTTYLQLKLSAKLSNVVSGTEFNCEQKVRVDCLETGKSIYCGMVNPDTLQQGYKNAIINSDEYSDLCINCDDLFSPSNTTSTYTLNFYFYIDNEWKISGSMKFRGSNNY